MTHPLLRLLPVLLTAYSVLGTPGFAEEPAAVKPPWQRLLQGADLKKAADFEEQVKRLQQAGQWADAVRVAEAELELRQKVQGKDHWETATALWQVRTIRHVAAQDEKVRSEYVGYRGLIQQAEALGARGQYQKALAVRQQIEDLMRKVLGEDYPDTATSCYDVAAVLRLLGRFKDAEAGYRKALTIYLRTLGEKHPYSNTALGALALSIEEQGRYKEAEEGHRKALAIDLELLGEEHTNTAAGYMKVAVNLIHHGRFREAEEGLNKALQIRRKVLPRDHPDTAYSCNNLGMNRLFQGKYREAEDNFREAVGIFRKVHGEEHPNTVQTYSNLAGALSAQGKHREAEEGFRKALDCRRLLLGEDHPDTAQSYNNVASNLQAQGRYREAEAGFRRALEILHKVYGEKHPLIAICSNHLAVDLNAQGRFREAAEALQKALEIRLDLLGERHPETARTYHDLAANLSAQGQYQAAEEGYRKATALFVAAHGEEHPTVATASVHLARALVGRGRYEEAAESCARALAIRRKVFGEQHLDTADAYRTMGGIRHAQGRYWEAVPFLEHAADAFQVGRLRLAASGLARATRTSEQSPLTGLAAILARTGDPSEAWKRFEESLARGTWDDLSARLRRPRPEQLRQANLAARLDRLDLQLQKVRALGKLSEEQQRQREEWLGQRLKAGEELARFAEHLEKTYGPAAGKVFSRESIQKALPEDTALVGWIDFFAGGPKPADPNGEHWAFLLRSKGDPVCVRLEGSGAGGTWTAEDTGLPADLAAAAREHRGDWQQLARRLHSQRFAPLAKHLAAGGGLPAVRRLLVLPSSQLAGVPVELFAAEYTVSYTLSGTLHAHLHSQPRPKSQGLLALGDPVFESVATTKERPLPPGGVLLTVVPPRSNAALAGLRPEDVLLKYGDVELRAPADLWAEPESDDAGKRIVLSVWRSGKTLELAIRPGKLGAVLADRPAPEALKERYRLDCVLATRSGDGDWKALPGTRVEVESLRRLFADKPEPKLLFDADASEQNLDALAQSGELGKYRYLHLATHGEVDDTVSLRSAVILSRNTLPDPQKQLLAGKPVYDGRLTGEEMLRTWQLDCDLMTLSACQTALGKYERGEGFMGFAQALLICGSRSVCLSLWKVDDAATALLMQRFYANLLGKREGLTAPFNKAEALREAKEWLRGLSRAEALRMAAEVSQGVERGKGRPRQKLLPPLPETTAAAKDDRPYAHPYYWAAFVLIGDPD
jgi:tetratricopeptide (TPR) repeat protein